MISSAAQSTPRARLALARASNSAAQQTRHYQYGPWHVEADHTSAARPRAVRYRYMETMSRRLAWDTKCAGAAAQSTPSYSKGMASTTAAYGNAGNIAAERQAVENLLRPQQDTPQSVDKLRLPRKSVRDYVDEFAPKGSTQTVDAEKVIEATSQFPKHKDLDGYQAASFDDPNTPWELTSEETSKHYNDLQKYRPIEWNEPSGLARSTPEELSKNYDDLHKYGPVKWNEPDGLQPPSAEELSKNYEDLHRYSQYETASPQDPPKHYVDQTKYAEFPHDPVERIHPEELSRQYGDLSAYPRAGFEEPNVEDHAHPEELSKNYTDLSSYNPTAFDSVDKTYPAHPEELTKDYKDLNSYRPVFDDEVAFSKPLKPEFNEHDLEIHLKTAAHQSSADKVVSGAAAEDAPNGTIKAAAKSRFINLEDAKKEYQTSFEADVPRGPVTEAQPIVDVELEAARRLEKLEDGKAEYAAEWGAEEHQQPPVAEQLETVAEQRLSNLEEAKVEHESTFEAIAEDLQASVPPQEKDEGLSSMDESFPPNGHDTVQEALTKVKKSKMAAAQRAQVQLDPFSQTPQGLETKSRRRRRQ